MMLGATAFEGVVCSSSPDICASDDFARTGLTPAPSTSRLKSRRFIALPLDCPIRVCADGQVHVLSLYNVHGRHANLNPFLHATSVVSGLVYSKAWSHNNYAV